MDEEHPLPEMLHRSSSLLRKVTYAFAGTVVLLVGVILWAVVRPPTVPTYAPLGDFPVQSVTTAQPIPVGSDIGVTATKCSNATSPVQTAGRLSWQSISSRGSAYLVGEGVGVRLPGCRRVDFENPMPAQVQDRVRQLAAQGTHISTWVITGQETPVAPDGQRPVVKAYTSERFQIVG